MGNKLTTLDINKAIQHENRKQQKENCFQNISIKENKNSREVIVGYDKVIFREIRR